MAHLKGNMAHLKGNMALTKGNMALRHVRIGYMKHCIVYIHIINPRHAGPGYIRFQENLNPYKMPLKLIQYSVVDAQLIKYFNLGDVYFS